MNVTLLILLFICHFLADYTPLSTAWMLNAKRFGKPLFPIFCHAAVHACLMAITILLICGKSWTAVYLILFQLITHFIIDVWKGRMNGWFPILQDNTKKWHWVIFGLDQTLHAIVIILMVSFIK